MRRRIRATVEIKADVLDDVLDVAALEDAIERAALDAVRSLADMEAGSADADVAVRTVEDLLADADCEPE